MRFILNILETAIMIFFVAAATLGLSEVMLARGLDPFLVRLAGLLLVIILALNGLRRAFSRPQRVEADTSRPEEEKRKSSYIGVVAGFMFVMAIAAQIRNKIQVSGEAQDSL